MDRLVEADVLAARLKVPVWTDPDELAQVNAFLDDASAELRSAIDQPISRATSTVVLYAGDYGRVTLPTIPVIEVTGVEVEGDVVDEWRLRGQVLSRIGACPGDEVEVTYTHGWDVIPDDIVKWVCVLAAAQLDAAVSRGTLGMTAGVVSEDEQIDDYRRAVTHGAGNGAAEAGMVLPEVVAAKLKARYGGGGAGWVTYR